MNDLAILLSPVSGNLWVLSGAEIRPHSQLNLGDFFPNFEEKNPNLQILTKYDIIMHYTVTNFPI